MKTKPEGTVTETPLLSVENLVKRYGGRGRGREVLAVDGVSFELSSGETLGVVGESGCGKSTLGNCLTRLMAPTAGRIMFEGRDLANMRQRELRTSRRGMQVVFQNSLESLNPRMRVKRLIEEPLRLQATSKAQRAARVADLLADVGLGAEHLERYPHQLSGGQQQRVVIARAVALRPKLVVLDEPTSSLDFVVREAIIALLAEVVPFAVELGGGGPVVRVRSRA